MRNGVINKKKLVCTFLFASILVLSSVYGLDYYIFESARESFTSDFCKNNQEGSYNRVGDVKSIPLSKEPTEITCWYQYALCGMGKDYHVFQKQENEWVKDEQLHWRRIER